MICHVGRHVMTFIRRLFSSSLPEQNSRCFADDISKNISFYENVRISTKISLKFVPKGPIDSKAALDQVMAWLRTGVKSLPQPIMTVPNLFWGRQIFIVLTQWITALPLLPTSSLAHIRGYNQFNIANSTKDTGGMSLQWRHNERDGVSNHQLHVTIVYWTVYSGADQRKHQSSASLAFVRGIHLWPVYSPHKGPVTPKMFPFDDVIMVYQCLMWIMASTEGSVYVSVNWVSIGSGNGLFPIWH